MMDHTAQPDCQKGKTSSSAATLDRRHFLITAFVLAALALASVGCGGGTSGTGPLPTGGGNGKALNGVVSQPNGTPISGAVVTLPSTGDTGTTDGNGAFTFYGQTEDTNVAIEVQSADFQGSFDLKSLPYSSSVNLQLTVGASALEVNSLELTVPSIGGSECENSFEAPTVYQFAGELTPPLVIINQKRQLPLTAHCLVQLQILRDGAPGSHTPFEVVFISSSESPNPTLQQRVIAHGITDASGSAEVALDVASQQFGTEGYFSVEASTNRLSSAITPTTTPAKERVAVIINPLRTE